MVKIDRLFFNLNSNSRKLKGTSIYLQWDSHLSFYPHQVNILDKLKNLFDGRFHDFFKFWILYPKVPFLFLFKIPAMAYYVKKGTLLQGIQITSPLQVLLIFLLYLVLF